MSRTVPPHTYPRVPFVPGALVEYADDTDPGDPAIDRVQQVIDTVWCKVHGEHVGAPCWHGERRGTHPRRWTGVCASRVGEAHTIRAARDHRERWRQRKPRSLTET